MRDATKSDETNTRGFLQPPVALFLAALPSTQRTFRPNRMHIDRGQSENLSCHGETWKRPKQTLELEYKGGGNGQ